MIIRLILLRTALCCNTLVFSQSNTFELSFDHQAIMVNALTKSADFYQNVLDLEEIDNKTGNSHIR